MYSTGELRVVDELQCLKFTLLILRPNIRADLGRSAREGLLGEHPRTLSLATTYKHELVYRLSCISKCSSGCIVEHADY